jgi:hypothetical protein
MKYLKKSQIDEDRSGTFGNYHLTLENINSANINGRINQKIDEGQADMEFKVKSTAKMTASKINKDIGTLLVNPETQNGKELAVKCISDLIHKNKNDVHTDEGMIPAMENVYLPGLDKLDVEDDSELAAKKHYEQMEIQLSKQWENLPRRTLAEIFADGPLFDKQISLDSDLDDYSAIQAKNRSLISEHFREFKLKKQLRTQNSQNIMAAQKDMLLDIYPQQINMEGTILHGFYLY